MANYFWAMVSQLNLPKKSMVEKDKILENNITAIIMADPNPKITLLN